MAFIWYNIWLTQDLIPRENIVNIIEQFAHNKHVRGKKMDDKQIEKQVERWDLFARFVPAVFLVVSGGLILAGIIDYKQAFWAAVVVTAVTAVTWWFWTIFTIRHLVRILNRASENLGEVKEEFKKVSKQVQDLHNK